MNAKDIAEKLAADTAQKMMERRRSDAQGMVEAFTVMLAANPADQGAAFCAHGIMAVHLAVFAEMDEDAFVDAMRESFRSVRGSKP